MFSNNNFSPPPATASVSMKRGIPDRTPHRMHRADPSGRTEIDAPWIPLDSSLGTLKGRRFEQTQPNHGPELHHFESMSVTGSEWGPIRMLGLESLWVKLNWSVAFRILELSQCRRREYGPSSITREEIRSNRTAGGISVTNERYLIITKRGKHSKRSQSETREMPVNRRMTRKSVRGNEFR